MMMETPEAFSRLHVDTSVMELPVVVFSPVDRVHPSQSGFGLLPPSVVGTPWGSLHCIAVLLQGCSLASSLTSMCRGCTRSLLVPYFAGNQVL